MSLYWLCSIPTEGSFASHDLCNILPKFYLFSFLNEGSSNAPMLGGVHHTNQQDNPIVGVASNPENSTTSGK
jgi:hypothetical protein